MLDALLQKLILKPYPVPSDRLWFDPMALTVNSQVLPRTVNLPANTDTVVATPSPRRYMIGFVIPNPTATIYVSPFNDPVAFPFSIGTLNNTVFWYSLFQYGPLVGNKWTANTTNFGGANLRVVEILRG